MGSWWILHERRNENLRRDNLFLFGGVVAANLVADFDNDTESLAVFGQGTYAVNDRLSLTLGGRWTQEDKTIDIVQSVDVGGGVLFPLFTNVELEAVGTDTRPRFTQFTPKVGVEYSVGDEGLLYASYTEGFKSGGWNARATDPNDFNLIDAETAKAYEIGYKSQFLNNRLRFNAALFLNDYDDFIVTAVNPVTGGFVTINAAQAQISGLELELNAQITDGLDVYASLGLLDNEYKSLGENVVFDINNEIKRTPEVSGQIGFNYYMPINNDDRIIVSADYSYQDEYFNGPTNTLQELSQSTDIVHASIAYEGSDGRWRVTASCQNCTDEEYFHSTLDFSALGFATQFPGAPRLYTVKLNVNF